MTSLISKPMPLVVTLEDSDEDFDTMQEAIRKTGLAAEVRRATTGEACLQLL